MNPRKASRRADRPSTGSQLAGGRNLPTTSLGWGTIRLLCRTGISAGTDHERSCRAEHPTTAPMSRPESKLHPPAMCPGFVCVMFIITQDPTTPRSHTRLLCAQACAVGLTLCLQAALAARSRGTRRVLANMWGTSGYSPLATELERSYQLRERETAGAECTQDYNLLAEGHL